MGHVCDSLRPPWDPCPCGDVDTEDAYLDAVVAAGPADDTDRDSDCRRGMERRSDFYPLTHPMTPGVKDHG